MQVATLSRAEPANSLACPAPLAGYPPIPPSIGALLASCDSAAPSAEIAQAIEAEPALVTALLRLASSPYLGVNREVTSVRRAVSGLDRDTLVQLVLCLSVRAAVVPQVFAQIDTEAYWSAALYRGVAAGALGARAGLGVHECFAMGFLLDIGLLSMLHARPDLVGCLDSLLQCNPHERCQLERDTFGATHEDAGRALAAHWQLPPVLVEVIAEHHQVERSHAKLTALGDLCKIARGADWLASAFFANDNAAAHRGLHEILAQDWGLGAGDVSELLAVVADDAPAAAQAWGIRLSRVAHENGLDDASTSIDVEGLTPDELNDRLRTSLEERDRFARELRVELGKARQIQRSLLPHPTAHSALQSLPFAGINMPARDLSGDFYDYLRLDDGRYYFTIADVSGKGVDAALLMAKTSSLFHCLGKMNMEPERLMSIINTELYEMSVRGMFVTMVCGLYDPERARVQLVNAGHPPPLLFDRDGQCTVVPAQAPPLGVAPISDFAGDEYALEGSLYLFTDGLLDVFSKDGSRFGYDGIIGLIRQCNDIAPYHRLVRMVTGLSNREGTPRDDVTVLLLEPAAA